MSGDELRIVPMRRRDLRSVLEVEHRIFPEPWSYAVFASELSLRKARAYRVARVGRDLVGYFGELFVDDEAHVTTVGVTPEWQGRGVATSLLADGIRNALQHGAHQVSLEVAAGNERAQALYRRFGFMPVGVRKGYYPVTGEDALVMWVYDIDSPRYQDRLAQLEGEAEAARSGGRS